MHTANSWYLQPLPRYGIVQLQTCGHPQAHQKKKAASHNTANKADLETSNQTITN